MKYKHLLTVFLCVFFHAYDAVAQAPVLEATGNQLYCPLSEIPIVEDFTITSSSNTAIDALYIQISEGYKWGTDFLQYKGINPDISSSFDPATGRLILSLPTGASSLIIERAIKNVYFRSTDPMMLGKRVFSITIDDANYLESTGHFYKYYPAFEISWHEARTRAQQEVYYGLNGYLATLTSLEEAVLCGEQSTGTGWIGGTDEETEGVWKWITGPEGLNGGLIFWYGDMNGSSPNFAYWNPGEPNNSLGNENYAHITDPSIGIRGAWNDLKAVGEESPLYKPQGYLVEFGGMPGDPVLQIATSSQLEVPVIIPLEEDTRCGPGPVSLQVDATGGTINWYSSATGGSPIASGPILNTPVSSSITFYVAAEPNGCNTMSRTPMQVTVYDPLEVNPQVSLTNCDEDGNPDGYTLFNLENSIPLITTSPEITISFFPTRADAENNAQEAILEPFGYSNKNGNVVYARSQNNYGCYAITRVDLMVATTSFPSDYVYNLDACDTDGQEDGFYEFNLAAATTAMLDQFPSDNSLKVSFYRKEEDALLQINPLPQEIPYLNEIAGEQTLFVRVDNTEDSQCYGIGPHLRLRVLNLPQFEIINEGYFCKQDASYTLKISNAGDNYTYEWKDNQGTILGTQSQIVVDAPGLYWVTASNNRCTSAPQKTEVKYSEPAVLDASNLRITSNGSTNQLSLNNLENLGAGDYEFALDNKFGPYQNQPIFENLTPGFKTLYVRDKNGCGISSIEVAVLGFPPFFTPNSDGYNDTWFPKGLSSNSYASVEIIIVNRFGKLLSILEGFNQSWDGTSQQIPQPADDYWYRVTLTDFQGRKIQFNGHFSLKR